MSDRRNAARKRDPMTTREELDGTSSCFDDWYVLGSFLVRLGRVGRGLGLVTDLLEAQARGLRLGRAQVLLPYAAWVEVGESSPPVGALAVFLPANARVEETGGREQVKDELPEPAEVGRNGEGGRPRWRISRRRGVVRWTLFFLP